MSIQSLRCPICPPPKLCSTNFNFVRLQPHTMRPAGCTVLLLLLLLQPMSAANASVYCSEAAQLAQNLAQLCEANTPVPAWLADACARARALHAPATQPIATANNLAVPRKAGMQRSVAPARRTVPEGPPHLGRPHRTGRAARRRRRDVGEFESKRPRRLRRDAAAPKEPGKTMIELKADSSWNTHNIVDVP